PAAGEAQVRAHGPGLLAESGLIDAAGHQPVGHRGRRERLVHGDDARAADADAVDVVAAVVGNGRPLRFGQRRRFVRVAGRRARFGDDRHERRAITVDAGVVFVAGALIDAALRAERRLHGKHREAVALDPAVAAAFADPLIDHHAGRAVRNPSALAQATRLG